ncbi:MAG TPA: hypothetical protein VGX50_05545 [Longimicrobium sp.]|jgi:hypothetical protein|nr:hypothetical protein [Longimicrobium sp.]
MTRPILRSVRFAFVTLMLGLTAYTGLESVVGGSRTAVAQASEGLSTCGSESQPCVLEPLAVVAEPAPAGPAVQLAEGLTACGTEETPCVLEAVSVEAERADARLASTERAVGMTMRVRS